jgi:hypothetical protein
MRRSGLLAGYEVFFKKLPLFQFFPDALRFGRLLGIQFEMH